MNAPKLIAIAVLAAAASMPLFAQGQGTARLHSRETYPQPEFLEVSGLEYAVEMIGTRRSDVEVVIYTEEPRRIEIDEVRGHLRIKVNTRPGGLFSRLPLGRIEISVPMDMNAAIQTASGSIRVMGLRESRSIEVGSASGRITVEDATGMLELKTASGAIRVDRADGPKTIDTASGSVRVRSSRGAVESSTGSGSTTIEDVEGDIDARTSSGRIVLRNVTGELRARTASGGIDGEAVLLTGDSSFRSISGGIQLQLENAASQLRIEAESVSGRVSVGRETGKSVRIGTGPIEVSMDTTSGAIEVE